MRKMTYDPELRKVKLEYSPDMRLYEYSLSEVMLRPNTRPFFIFAESNSGKTVIGVICLLKQCRREYLTNFNTSLEHTTVKAIPTLETKF